MAVNFVVYYHETEKNANNMPLALSHGKTQITQRVDHLIQLGHIRFYHSSKGKYEETVINIYAKCLYLPEAVFSLKKKKSTLSIYILISVS